MNLPPSLYNMPWMQNMPQLQQGPQWSETNPFRTVDKAGQYGTGTNASAAQLYDHFGSGGRNAMDYGFKPAGAVQGMQEFFDRNKPAQPDIWGNNTQAYKDRVAELMDKRGWTQQYSMGNQNHALGVGADFGNDGAVSNNEWAQHLGADSDGDGNVTNQEWGQYKGGQRGTPPPKLPGNIPGLGGGIFNLPQFNPQQPTPQQPTMSTGMPMVNRPQPGGTPPPQVTPNMGGFLQQTPGGQPQQPMTNPQMPQAPQVPQFNPSIFNMQPQMMVNRPRPMGV